MGRLRRQHLHQPCIAVLQPRRDGGLVIIVGGGGGGAEPAAVLGLEAVLVVVGVVVEGETEAERFRRDGGCEELGLAWPGQSVSQSAGLSEDSVCRLRDRAARIPTQRTLPSIVHLRLLRNDGHGPSIIEGLG